MINSFKFYFHVLKNCPRLLLIIISFLLILCNHEINAREINCNDLSILEDETRLNECAVIEANNHSKNFDNYINYSQSIVKYKGPTHQSLVEIALKSFFLSKNRINNIIAATIVPDAHPNIIALLKHPWTHLYMLNKRGNWSWGGADKYFQDNLICHNQNSNYENNSCSRVRGYSGLSAEYYYLQNNQKAGDWYLGYAVHFVTDVSTVIHSSLPSLTRLDILFKHTSFEQWIKNNFSKGHNFLSKIQNEKEIYQINDPAEDLKDIAERSSYWTSDVGYNVWNSYAENGYPVSEGTGDQELVENTIIMLKNTLSYIKGTIQFTLNKYQQLESKY
ncbi:MAG: zinc dependent phospholipase C family protein [Oligoflexia bacterium]|nr:zinc dependent phospholipase C family protein [Oligoflexia bacterium]